jgi:hypothetical protein
MNEGMNCTTLLRGAYRSNGKLAAIDRWKPVKEKPKGAIEVRRAKWSGARRSMRKNRDTEGVVEPTSLAS